MDTRTKTIRFRTTPEFKQAAAQNHTVSSFIETLLQRELNSNQDD